MDRSKLARFAPMNVLYKFFSLDYFLDAAAATGFQTIELWGAAPHLYIEEAGPAAIRRLREQLTSRGLEVCCLTPEAVSYPVNIAADDPVMRQRSLHYYKKSIEIANELDIRTVRVTSGTGYFHEPAAEAWKRSGDALATLAAEAGRLGVTLALEPLSSYDSNLVYDLQTAGRMLALVNSEALGLVVDTVTMESEGDTLEAYLQAFGSRIKHVQLCDGPEGHLAWGDGSLPLRSYRQTLEQWGYQGHYGLEMFAHRYYVDPDPVLRRCVNEIVS